MRGVQTKLALLSGALAGVPVGSIYTWSIFIDPLKRARPDWGEAGAHATSVVITALAVSSAISGRIAGTAVDIKLLCVWGALLSGFGFITAGLSVSVEDAPVALFYGGVLQWSWTRSVLRCDDQEHDGSMGTQ